MPAACKHVALREPSDALISLVDASISAMITGKQVREARELLGWSPRILADRAKVPVDIVAHAESADGLPSITLAQALKMQAVCESAGVRFGRCGDVVLLSAAS